MDRTVVARRRQVEAQVKEFTKKPRIITRWRKTEETLEFSERSRPCVEPPAKMDMKDDSARGNEPRIIPRHHFQDHNERKEESKKSAHVQCCPASEDFVEKQACRNSPGASDSHIMVQQEKTVGLHIPRVVPPPNKMTPEKNQESAREPKVVPRIMDPLDKTVGLHIPRVVPPWKKMTPEENQESIHEPKVVPRRRIVEEEPSFVLLWQKIQRRDMVRAALMRSQSQE